MRRGEPLKSMVAQWIRDGVRAALGRGEPDFEQIKIVSQGLTVYYFPCMDACESEEDKGKESTKKVNLPPRGH